MEEKTLRAYNELLSNKMVSMFDISKEEAESAIEESVLQKLILEFPEYVDITPLECWADEIYKETERRKVEGSCENRQRKC